LAVRRRKTKAERQRERDEANHRVWEQFQPKLASLQSYEDGEKLVAEAPHPDAPGRGYYSNLAFFLQNLSFPNGAGYAERVLYVQFLERMDAAGQLGPEGKQKIFELRRELEIQATNG